MSSIIQTKVIECVIKIFLCILPISPSLYFGLYLNLSNIDFCRKFYKIQNIYMLNMFTFDMLSVRHSLGQSVAGIVLFIFFTENLIKYKIVFLLFNPYFISTLFALNLVLVKQKNIYIFFCVKIQFFSLISCLIRNYFGPMDSLSLFY